MVNLVTKTNPSSSGDKGKQQFDQLASILGDGIIGNVWLYASRDVSAIRASIDVLPIIVEALGIGSVRYLKVRLQIDVCLTQPNPSFIVDDSSTLTSPSSSTARGRIASVFCASGRRYAETILSTGTQDNHTCLSAKNPVLERNDLGLSRTMLGSRSGQTRHVIYVVFRRY